LKRVNTALAELQDIEAADSRTQLIVTDGVFSTAPGLVGSRGCSRTTSGPSEVVIRVKKAAICGTDMHNRLTTRLPTSLPLSAMHLIQSPVLQMQYQVGRHFYIHRWGDNSQLLSDALVCKFSAMRGFALAYGENRARMRCAVT